MIAGKPRSLIVAGVMSGTSADGVDVALVRISPGRSAAPRVDVLGHREFPYSRTVRQAVLRAMDAEAISVAELARLNWRLGAVYAESVQSTAAALGMQPELIALHGQTLYHQAGAAPFAGGQVRATWQTGEAAVLRECCGVPVVSDFRPADLAAGGQGAPLVPMLDFALFRSRTVDRVLLNLGGIANVTVLPAGCAANEVLAFDTGPANMVMDALMQRHFAKAFDRDGLLAGSGAALRTVVRRVLRDPYFTAAPPKSCGREQFGAAFCARLEKLAPGASAADLLATAAEITVQAVVGALTLAGVPTGAEIIAAGGGVRNGYVMRRLGEELGSVKTSAEFGLAPQSKEAVAFALLAWLSWFGQSGNLPAATGAAGPRVLGKVLL